MRCILVFIVAFFMGGGSVDSLKQTTNSIIDKSSVLYEEFKTFLDSNETVVTSGV
jgi:hypothetical protein